MPPRHNYWTIIFGNQPTSFRAATQEELLPTLKQLQAKHPDAVMMWFASGRLWKSEDEARQAREARWSKDRPRDPRWPKPPWRDRPEGDRRPPPFVRKPFKPGFGEVPPRQQEGGKSQDRREGDRPRGPRPEWKDRGPKPQWRDKPQGDRPAGDKPAWQPSARKPFPPRVGDAAPKRRDGAEWKDRPAGEKAAWQNRGPKPPWKDRPQGDRPAGEKPAWQNRGPKPAWKDRPHGDRPRGPKPEWRDRSQERPGAPPAAPKSRSDEGGNPRSGEGGKPKWRDRPQGNRPHDPRAPRPDAQPPWQHRGPKPEWKHKPPDQRDQRGPRPEWKDRGPKPPAPGGQPGKDRWRDRPGGAPAPPGSKPGPPKPRSGEGGRGRDWRPGGQHKDPRDRFKVPRDVKRARFKDKLRRDRTLPKKKKDEE
jgi:hypothetical protein